MNKWFNMEIIQYFNILKARLKRNGKKVRINKSNNKNVISWTVQVLLEMVDVMIVENSIVKNVKNYSIQESAFIRIKEKSNNKKTNKNLFLNVFFLVLVGNDNLKKILFYQFIILLLKIECQTTNSKK